MNRLFFLLAFLLAGPFAPAQQTDTAFAGEHISPYVQKVRAVFARQKKANEEKYRSGKNAIDQRNAMEEAKNALQQASLYLRNGMDTAAILRTLHHADTTFAVIRDGIFINKGTAQTERNLSVSSAILFQLILSLEAYKEQVDHYSAGLSRFRDRIDSLFNQPAIYAIATDSAQVARYIARISVIAREAGPADDALEATLIGIQELQNKIDARLFNLREAYAEIERHREQLSAHTLKREFPNLWDTSGYSRPFSTIAKFSLIKEKIALQFYMRENTGKLLLVFIFILLFSFSLRALGKRLREDGHLTDDMEEPLIVRHAVPASIVVVLSIFQFLFFYAPFIFNAGLWLTAMVSLLILFRRFVSSYWLRFWVIALALFGLVCTDNLILQASRTERWIMIALTFSGLLFGLVFLTGGHKRELKERSILYGLRFLVLAEALSLLFNLFGRYNLAKAIMVSGYTGLTIAVLFLWVVRLLNEGLSLANTVYRHSERGFLNINFNRLGNKTPRLLYLFLVVGWLVLIGRHFYAFKRISLPFIAALKEERNIGEYTFSINGLFLFLSIAFISVLLSKLVSFFAADPDATHGSTSHTARKGVSTGSWILLLRIVIISVGLFLALAASGVALDKLTIILGALGVGIGLGLQDLVKNLVSGLVIAFERPVKAGDLVEINGKLGTMKSIGFRSSIVLLVDGASLVVPNGDLLSEHLVNWNLSRNMRRLSLQVGIAYGSNLEQAKALLEEIAGKEEHVLEYPAPAAAARHFGDSAIRFELVYWIRQTSDSMTITGNIIFRIDKAFKAAGIVIPFPHQDLYPHHPPSSTDPDQTASPENAGT